MCRQAMDLSPSVCTHGVPACVVGVTSLFFLGLVSWVETIFFGHRLSDYVKDETILVGFVHFGKVLLLFVEPNCVALVSGKFVETRAGRVPFQ